MSKKHNHIEQLSPELFQAYQEGNLSADEMYAVEKYLLENPFEAEALEGLETLAPGTLRNHLDDLNSRMATQLSAAATTTKSIFWTTTMKIAATLLIIITASFLYFQLDQQEAPIRTKEITQNSEDAEKTTKKESITAGKAEEPEADSNAGIPIVEREKQLKEAKPKRSDNLEVAEPEPAAMRTEELVTSLDQHTEGAIADLAVRAKTQTPKTLELDNDINMSANNLITTDSVTLVASQGDFDQKLRGRSSGVILKNSNKPVVNKKELLEEVSNESQQDKLQANGYLYDSITKLKVEEEKLKTLSQIRAQSEGAKQKAIGNSMGFVADNIDSLTKVITGIVTDDMGEPLRGVHVQLKGTSIGILTDENGSYTLKTPVKNGNILFRYLGYNTQEIPMSNFNVLNVEMKTDIIYDSEVMVSDYAPPLKEEEADDNKNHYPARPVYGQKALSAHIKENLIYPEAAKAKRVRGRVTVEFTVKENGDLEDFKILKSLGYGCDEEAIRLIKTGPRWQARIAGVGESRPVESRVKVRIKFKP